MNQYSYNAAQKKQSKQCYKNKVDEVLCPEGYKALFVCISKNCSFSAFACAEEHCKCEQVHSNCLTVRANQILKKLYSKINVYQPLIDENNRIIQEKINQFQRMIASLRQQKDKLYYKLVKKLQFAGMNKLQKNIYQHLITKKTDDIKGSDISMIQVALEDEIQTMMEKQQKFLKQYWNIQIQNINELKQKIQKMHLSFQSKIKETQQQQNIKKESQNKIKAMFQNEIKNQKLISYESQMLMFNPYQIQEDKNVQNQVTQKKYNISQLRKSNVVKKKEEKQFLFKLFQDKTDVSFQLLFKASQYDFQIRNFKQLCAGIPHTITIIKTNKNIKIGGYTPLCWEQKQQWQQLGSQWYNVNNIIQDQLRQTFLFSITDQVKLKAKQSVGICNQSVYGPCFIAPFQNENKSWQYDVCLSIQGIQQWIPTHDMNVSMGFQNENYDSRYFFGKKINEDFYPKQWQVWKINFKSQAIKSQK